ncbi:MAG: sulfatase, partial [Thermoprotei archaeon]
MEESTYKKILLIAIDTLCVDHLGCYGYDVPRNPTTPFIDSLAEKGAIFRKHYAADVPTPSSFTSLFTGIRGIRHGIIGFKNKSN